MRINGELILFLILAVGIPGLLTIWNLYNCFAKRPVAEKIIACLTVFIGGFFYMGFHVAVFEMAGDWDQAVYVFQYHYSVSSVYWLVPMIVVLFGFTGYFILLFGKAGKIPPLVSALSVSMLILLNIFHLTYALQLLKNMSGMDHLLYVYHANILILSARVIHRHMKEQVEVFRSRAAEVTGDPSASGASEAKKHGRFFSLLDKIDTLSKYSAFIFIVFFFAVAVIELIFVLLGQGIDAPVKMFTDTADWTFSRQIPPPPLEYDGHYLCTVAAGGHRKVVKPIRFGTRRNETIVVNRQLCIANAFEELIQERRPRFHRWVRHMYDTHGYPLSRVITTPFRADLTYIIMKPAEWLFLMVLYAFDTRPEQRIARQYTYTGPGR